MASTTYSAPPTAKRNSYLARFAWAVLAWNVLVILWGALVRATGSGAGCGNHWPLCNGEVIPLSPSFHTIVEFTHRMMTGGSTFLMIGLLVWTLRSVAKPHPARKAVWTATLFLVLEAILGALLVKLGYVTGNQSVGRVIVLSIHLTNTLLLLATLTLTAWLLGGNRVPRPRGVHWFALASTIVVGVSGSLAALGDTLFPATSLRAAFAQDIAAGSPMILRLRGVHPASVVLSTIALVWLIARIRPQATPRTAKLISATIALLVFQVGLGLADLALLAPWWMQILHLLGADLFWIALLALVFDSSAEPAQA
ncbi:MAG: COX15/CtaA family protein [Acidobacteria bacterium]|nr:COX15/CtaA family protein [Acidobacteriota bacterium]